MPDGADVVDGGAGRLPASVALRGVTVRYGATTALDRVDLELRPGTFTALLGPSGSGKSTALTVLAGLREPDEGDVLLDGRSVRGVAPERRPVGLVFQKPLLFPHLSVLQNVAFGLRMDRVARRTALRRAAAMLERVRLGGVAGRRPGELSGGQEQRVALARALVRRPRVLLLDEPYSQLDPDLRVEVRRLVRELHDEASVTTLLVTHDREDAVEVADRVVLVQDGRTTDLGTPREAWTRPVSLAAARFLGVGNELVGEVGPDGWFRTADGAVAVPGRPRSGTASGTASGSASGSASASAVLVVRPESLVLAVPDHAGDGGGAVRVPALVEDVRFAGAHVVVRTLLPDGQRLTVHVAAGTEPTVGDTVRVGVPAERCTVFALPG